MASTPLPSMHSSIIKWVPFGKGYGFLDLIKPKSPARQSNHRLSYASRSRRRERLCHCSTEWMVKRTAIGKFVSSYVTPLRDTTPPSSARGVNDWSVNPTSATNCW
ncbi:hypothetical protein LIA77_04681 [Sarocladium implicatum]|nr:hypothetical protein LIA77_04681 [Sarocladium implicatum]